jgi:anti-sigma factor RsiW
MNRKFFCKSASNGVKMKKDAHAEIRKDLLSFLAGELPEKRRETVSLHLSQCPECSRYLKILAKAWNAESVERPPVPLSLSWESLIQRIQEHERKSWIGHARGFRFRPLSARLLVASVAFPIALFLAIAIGIYIGTPTVTGTTSTTETLQALSGGKIEAFGLELFNVLPPGSLAESLANLE